MAKEQWVWICNHHQDLQNWYDSGECGATSKKTFPTKEKAEKALARHIRNAGHTHYIYSWRMSALDVKCGTVKKLNDKC